MNVSFLRNFFLKDNHSHTVMTLSVCTNRFVAQRSHDVCKTLHLAPSLVTRWQVQFFSLEHRCVSFFLAPEGGFINSLQVHIYSGFTLPTTANNASVEFHLNYTLAVMA